MSALVDLLRRLDRRIIYGLLFLSVIVPMLKPLNLPIDISVDVRNVYDTIDRLPEGSVVLISFDYEPASRAEVHPMAEAVLHHCFRKKLKVVAPALWPQGPSLATGLLDKLAKLYNLKYGEDYVQLGYFSGPNSGLPQVSAIMSNLTAAYPVDTKGNATANLPLTRRITSPREFALVFTLSAGDPGIPGWVQIANGRYGAVVAGGATAVQTPQYIPYVQAGQMVGILGGLKGAAEYEFKVGVRGLASAGMDAQSFAHVLILSFILIANITYFHDRWFRPGGARRG
jgi:hypothetical protein